MVFHHHKNMINFILLVSRQGKTRLSKWFVPMKPKERNRAMREINSTVLARQQKMCNFLEW